MKDSKLKKRKNDSNSDPAESKKKIKSKKSQQQCIIHIAAPNSKNGKLTALINSTSRAENQFPFLLQIRH